MDDNHSVLMEKFFRIVMLLHRYRHYNRGDQNYAVDPHRGQGRVLSLLKMKPEVSQKELSYLLDIRSQSLGELLTKLERNGLITRTPSEKDRRVMNVKLTESGFDMANQTEEEQQNNNKMFECLNDIEQATLDEYLNRLINELEKRLGNEDVSERNFGDVWGERGGHQRPPFGFRGGRGPNGFPFQKGQNERMFGRKKDKDSQNDEAEEKDE